MKKRYLVFPENGTLQVPPVYVVAETKEQAVTLYCRKVQSKEEYYRAYVRGQGYGEFTQILLSKSLQVVKAADGRGFVKPPMNVIRSKILDYFSSQPKLGEQYMLFLEHQDPSVLSEEVYEFISERDQEEYEVFDETTIPILAN